MKYVLALLLGLLVGNALFVVGLIYNPFASTQGVSPLSVSEASKIALSYSGVATDNIVFSNDGESRVAPHPEKVLQLWEASIRQTTALVTVLRDARNQVVGMGVKFSSRSEDTRLLNGEALVDSVWYLSMPGRGSLFFEQRENHWDFLRHIVVRAYRNSSNSWKGSWYGTITVGPHALATGKVTGGSGEFAGNEMLGIESLSVRAWSADSGPISSEGSIIIELPLLVEDSEE